MARHAEPAVKVVLFCGGQGLRLRGAVGSLPKPMVSIGGRPLLWHIMRYPFSSQRGKAWFTEDLFMGLMRIRGMESSSPTGLAEGFYARKLAI